MNTPKDRVRVTISLAKEVADQIDAIIDGVRIRNRSHAIETLVTESLDLIQVQQAVILAGGESAVERLPAIEKMLSLLKNQGIFDIILAVGYLGDTIKDTLGNGEAYGVKIHYSQSDQGTGGALLQLKPKLRRTFIAINVNEAISLDLKALFKFHRDHQALVTIAVQSLRDLQGVYVMDPKVLSLIPPSFCMLEDTIFQDLTRQGKLISYPINT